MPRPSSERVFDVNLQFGQRLARKRIHQIQIEVIEVTPRDVDRSEGLRAIVNPAERLELFFVERLDSDR